jgi:hypothetical protein
MIPRRLTKHVKDHNWFAVIIDLAVVIIGVFIGIQVSNWNQSVKDRDRTDRVIETLRTSLSDSVRVEERVAGEIGAGLAAFDAAIARGERPIPYVFRIPGSEPAVRPGVLLCRARRHRYSIRSLCHVCGERDTAGGQAGRYSFLRRERKLETCYCRKPGPVA